MRLALAVWLALLALLAGEYVVAVAHLSHLFVFACAAVMVGLVITLFMRVGSGNLTRAFAIAGGFWLLVLLGLGLMDPLTRVDYPVAAQGPSGYGVP